MKNILLIYCKIKIIGLLTNRYKILDYVNYLFLKFYVMNLLILLIENFINLNAKNVEILILVIFLNIILIDPDYLKFRHIIKGFQTLGVRGLCIL